MSDIELRLKCIELTNNSPEIAKAYYEWLKESPDYMLTTKDK